MSSINDFEFTLNVTRKKTYDLGGRQVTVWQGTIAGGSGTIADIGQLQSYLVKLFPVSPGWPRRDDFTLSPFEDLKTLAFTFKEEVGPLPGAAEVN